MHKLAAAVAALAVVGWVVTGGTGTRQGASQCIPPALHRAAWWAPTGRSFAGRVDYARSTDSWFTSEYEDSGIRVGMGYSAHGDVVVTDDPRMVGTGTRTLNFFSRPTRMAMGISAAPVDDRER